MSTKFCISPQISSKLCVYADYIKGCYIFKKQQHTAVLLWKQTSHHLSKGDFNCIIPTIKFWYWSCSDSQHNRKNLVATLKELRVSFFSLSFFFLRQYEVFQTLCDNNLHWSLHSPSRFHDLDPILRSQRCQSNRAKKLCVIVTYSYSDVIIHKNVFVILAST